MADGEPPIGSFHHVELWVPDLERASRSWGWLLIELGWREHTAWPAGRSWILDTTYLVIEQSPALSGERHERTRPGLNHLAFHAGSRSRIDALSEAASSHGWTVLFPERAPWAGGAPDGDDPGHYAAYLEDSDGYEVELVAAAVASSE